MPVQGDNHEWSSVEAELARLETGLDELSHRYSGDWLPMFERVAGWYKVAWIKYEVDGCKAFRETIQHLKREMDGDLQERWRQKYRGVLEDAERNLKAMIKEAIEVFTRVGDAKKELVSHAGSTLEDFKSARETQLQAVEQIHQTEIGPLQEKAEAAKASYLRHLVGLRGEESHTARSVKPRNKAAEMAVLAPVLVLIFLAEIVAGKDSIANVTSELTAWVIVAVIALVVTYWLHLAVGHLRHLFAHIEAKRRFKKQYPEGHPKNYAVYSFPLNDALIGMFGTLVPLGIAISLLVFRIRQAEGQIDVTGQMIGAAVLTFLIFTSGIILYSQAGDFTDEQTGELGQLASAWTGAEKELVAMRSAHDRMLHGKRYELDAKQEEEQARLHQLKVPVAPENDSYKANIRKAVEFYEDQVDAAEAAVHNEAAELEAARRALLDGHSEYMKHWAMFDQAYWSALNQLFLLVGQNVRGLAPLKDSERKQAKELFAASVDRSFEDHGLITRMELVRFVPDLPIAQRITDFLSVEQEVRAAVRKSAPVV